MEQVYVGNTGTGTGAVPLANSSITGAMKRLPFKYVVCSAIAMVIGWVPIDAEFSACWRVKYAISLRALIIAESWLESIDSSLLYGYSYY